MILLIGHEASLTGAPKMLLALARWFKEVKNEKIEIILKNGGPLLEHYQKIAPVCIWNIEYKSRNLLRSAFQKLFMNPEAKRKQYIRSLNKKNIELIFCNTIVNGDILESLSCLEVPVVSRIPEMKMVIDMYNKKGLADKTFSHTDIYIAVSEAVKSNLINNYSIASEKIHVVLNGLIKNREKENGSVTRATAGIPENAFVAGACGTLIWRKGIDLFVRLAEEIIIRQQHADVFFLWVGGDISDLAFHQYTEEIKKLGLEKHIRITGETANPYDFYRLMDVFCMTSREEPFGLAMLEAASCGLPVISFDQSGFPAEFTTKDVGFTVPYTDISEMARKIIHLKDHSELHKTLSENIRKKSELFSFNEMAEKVYSVIQSSKK